MSDPAALGVEGPAGWVRLVAGALLFLLPGLAAADRWMPGGPSRLLWAPVFSVTIMALLAIGLDFAFGMPIAPLQTLLVAILAGAWIGRARLVAWGRLGWTRVARRG